VGNLVGTSGRDTADRDIVVNAGELNCSRGCAAWLDSKLSGDRDGNF